MGSEEEIPILEHKWNQGEIRKEPTCTESGTLVYVCEMCGAEGVVEEIASTGHTYGEWEVVKEATCTDNGEKKRNCKECGKTETETIPAQGHNIVKDEAIKATCTEKGFTEGSHCSVCGEILDVQKEIAAMGHEWDNGVVTKAATDVSEGVLTYTCRKCAGTRNVTIPVVAKVQTTPVSLTAGTVVNDAKTGGTYKVLSSDTVEYLKPTNAKASKVQIPKEVVLQGAAYRVTSLAKNAFANNKYLVNVTIGSNVTDIGAKAFYKCVKLKKIVIPAKVGKIGKQAFYGCKKLKNITIKTKKLTKKNVGSNAFKGISAKAVIGVPKAKLKVYKKFLKTKGAGGKVKIR